MKKANLSYKLLTNTVPNGAIIIDTVKTDQFPIGAVLIQYENTGMYALLSSGKVATCNQAEAKKYVKEINSTKLRNIRKNAGMTLADLASASGVGIRTIKSYDSGEKDINRAACGTVKAIADALNCRIEDLLEIKPDEEEEIWYNVIDDGGAEVDIFSFENLEDAKEKADSIYNHLTGYEIRHRSGLYVLVNNEPDSLDGDVVYKLI